MTDGPVTIGAYRLESQIGAGAMGTVHLATDLRLGRRVAVKLLYPHLGSDPAYLARFGHEAATLARLDSPHVIPIYDHGQHDGSPYLVTQYAAGGDLGAVLRTHGVMPPILAVELAAQVADGLAAAHAVGVIHRDVKPGNVLLREADLSRPHLYLADFGVAFTESAGLTAPGSVAGTWDYMAPERAQGHPGSPASDVYAVGCLLHEMLTGRPPYGGNDVEVAMAHLEAPVPQLPGRDRLTQGVNRVLARAMAKDPAARYPSAAAMRDDLRAVAAGTTSPAATSPVVPAPLVGAPAPATLPGPRRRRALVAVCTVAALVFVAGGVAAYVVSRGGGTTPVADPSASISGSTTSSPTSDTIRPITGDLNGDGLGDLIIDSSPDQHLFTSTGTRFAAAKHPHYLGNTETQGAVECDTDGDGRDDLVTVGFADSLVVNNIATGRTKKVVFPLHNYPSGAACADFNGDGLGDVALWSTNTKRNRITFMVALSLPGGGFGRPRTWFTETAAQTRFLELSRLVTGDFNGDGKSDVALFNPNNDAFTYFRSTGSRLVRSGARINADKVAGLPEEFGTPVVAADLNGDGKTEMVLVAFDGNVGVVRLTDSGWRRVEGYHPTSETFNPQILYATAVDVNGDGRDDIIAGGKANPWVYLSTPSGLRAPKQWTANNHGQYWRGMVGSSFSE